VLGLALVLAGTLAVTDYRTGHIPNWVTLPPLLAGPLLNGFVDGAEAALASLVAMVICGAVPLLMFWRQGMHGGDTKLFLAIAALCGTSVGLEAQLLAFIVAAIYAMGRLAWEGKLFATLGRTLYLGLNPILPKAWRKAPSPELLQKLRLGGAIFAGLLLVVVGRYQNLLFPGVV
jgi:prepilin peptidase CpaA